MDQNDQQSRSLERRCQVREVTQYQASWAEQGRGEEGRFTVQLILSAVAWRSTSWTWTATIWSRC